MIVVESKAEYLYKMFSNRTRNKDRENYVVNRIWSLLNDDRVHPITQQQIIRKSKNHERAMIDLYFPQINFGIEIDEDQHIANVEGDFDRFKDIREVNEDYEEFRIKVDKSRIKDLDFVHAQVDMAVSLIKRKFKNFDFNRDWFENLEHPDEVAKRTGKITVQQNLLFATHVQVLQSFNYQGKQMMRAGYDLSRLGYENGNHVWFPTIDQGENAAKNSYKWSNGFEEIDGKNYIVEFFKNGEQIDGLDDEWQHRIVFAKTKDPVFGKQAYKFIGVYQLDKEFSNSNKRYYKQISDEFQLI